MMTDQLIIPITVKSNRNGRKKEYEWEEITTADRKR